MSYIISALTFFSTILFGAQTASAHVAYVTPSDTLTRTGGIDFHFLFSPLADINNVIIIIAFLLLFGAIYYLGHHVPLFLKEISFIKKQLTSYHDLVPWILRIGLGIMLMGAGMKGVLISPIVPTVTSVAAWEFIIGFALLLGLFITPSLLAVIGFYFAGLFGNGYMFGNLEVFGIAVAPFLIANSRPGLDHIVGIPMLFRDRLARYAPLILRITIGGAFIFLAFFEKIFNPHYFGNVVDTFNLTTIIHVTPAMWTLSVGIIELIVGLCILMGFKTRLTSAIAFIVFICTFFFFKESVYSHVSIFAGLSALFILGGGTVSIDEHIENAKLLKASRKRTPTVKKRVTKTKKRTATRKRVS